jgi:hypothetical protein
MDLQEQRIACLRMAIDLGCKSDTVIATANELMSFVTSGAASPPATVAESEAPVSDAIAACGTALPASETAGLVVAQPTGETPANASEAPAVAQAIEPETVATEPVPGPAEAAPFEASPEPAPVATAPVEAVPASEPAAAAPAAAIDDPPVPGLPEAAEVAQLPAAEEGAAAEEASAAIAKDLPTPPPTAPNGTAPRDATSAAATAS